MGGIEGTSGENGRREGQRGYGGQIMDSSTDFFRNSMNHINRGRIALGFI